MSAYALSMQTRTQPKSGALTFPWSLVGPSEPESALGHQLGELRSLFGTESQRPSSFTREAVLEGQHIVKQERIKQQDAKRSNDKFAILSGFYTIRNPIAVHEFLLNRKPVFDLLFAALPKVKEAWGGEAKTELELLQDPEDESASLVVHVLSNHPNTYAALDQFDEQWWLNHIGESEGLLNFSVEP